MIKMFFCVCICFSFFPTSNANAFLLEDESFQLTPTSIPQQEAAPFAVEPTTFPTLYTPPPDALPYETPIGQTLQMPVKENLTTLFLFVTIYSFLKRNKKIQCRMRRTHDRRYQIRFDPHRISRRRKKC